MKTVFLALTILVSAAGLAAKPLTFTFEEYQIDPASYPKVDPAKDPTGEFYLLKLLAELKPIASQSVELSKSGNGQAVATIGDSKLTLEVRANPDKESSYRILVKHEFVSAYSGEHAITTSRASETGVTLKVGDALVVGSSRLAVGDSVETFVSVVKLAN